MNRNIIIAVIVGVLIIFAAVQAVQLSGIGATGNTVKVTGSQVQSGQQQSSSPAPSSAPRPAMVGGC